MTHTQHTSEDPVPASGDYRKTIHVHAPAEAVFDALTTETGLTAWWTRATGSGTAGGELELFMDAPEPLVIHVDRASRPASVRWTVVACSFVPDWVGTHPAFTITPQTGEACAVELRHHGLTRELDCIEMCTNGWNHFLESLRRYVETGCGMPHGSAADRARRR